MSSSNLKIKRKRHTSSILASPSATKLSVGRRSAAELPNIITINDEQYQIISKQEPIGRMEKDKLLRKHQKRLDEIESMHIRFGSNFSLHPRNLGEPFCYQEQINKTRQRVN